MIADFLNEYRVFPRIALCWLLWVGTDAYLWAKEHLKPEDLQWFSNLVIGAVIMGLFAYMNTGSSKTVHTVQQSKSKAFKEYD